MAAIDAQDSRAAGAAGADVRKHSLQLRVLGPLEALSDGVALTLGGRKERTALALLAAQVGTVVATDDLIDGIWGDEPTTAARSTLHTYISNLRSRVGDVIPHDGGGYRLEIEPDDLDAFVFEHAVSNARELAATDQAQAAQTLRQALALWRGRPYADVAGAPLLDVEARRLEELRLEAVEARIDADLALGRHAELAGELEVRPGGNAGTREIAVSPNGKRLAANHGGHQNPTELDLYRLPGGELLDAVEAHSGGVMDIEFSRDGSRLATAGVDGAAKVWEIRNGKLRELLALRSKPNPVMSVSFSPDATSLVTVGQFFGARVWDVSAAGRGEVLTLPGPESGPVPPAIAFTPDGRRLGASSGPAGTVRVWNVKTGAELLVIHAQARGHAQAPGVIGIDVSPDGSRIATAGADGSARVYDAKSGEELLAVRGRHCVGEGSCAVNRAVFSPDGTKIATTGSDATVRIMAADTGRELRVLRGRGPVGSGTYSLEWSKDGRRLLAFGKNGARVWDVESGRSLVRTEEAPGPGVAAAWSPDETQILTEGGSGPLVWDAATGRMVRTVAAGAPIEDIAFSRDGTRLALTTVDPSRSTQVWDWPRDVALLKLTDGAKRTAFSPDGKLLAGVRSEPTPYLHVWALDIDRLLEIARGRVTRSLTAAECRQYLQGPCP